MGNHQSHPKISSSMEVLFVEGGHTEIPYHIPNNNRLKRINASANHLQKLPPNIPELEMLVLSENGYTEIPQQILEVICTLNKLKTLILSSNKIGSIPPLLLTHKPLRTLELYANNIENVDFSQLEVEVIDISQNALIKFPLLPSTIKSFNANFNFIKVVKLNAPNLVSLSMVMNRISQFMFKKECLQMTRLEIPMNDIQELPDLVQYCPNLMIFDASNNYLNKFPNLPATVQELAISDNLIEEIPDSIINLVNLTKFDAHENKIKRILKLPESLKDLELYDNEISEIEDFELPNLMTCILVRNKIKTYPKMIKYATNCYIFCNEISTIPTDSVGPNLKFLNFSRNKLTEIPKRLLEFTAIQQVHFQDNQISKIPEDFKQMNPIQISLSMNPIKYADNLPKTCQIIAMSYCKLRKLPNFEAFDHLETISFCGNKLTSLPYFPKLKNAFLSRNRFKEFPKFPDNMEIIDISHNDIRDSVELYFPQLEDLDLSHNRISQLSNIALKNIISLKVSDNPLAQTLLFAQFPNLENVDIANTKVKFSDEIPVSVREVIYGAGEPSFRRKIVPKCSWCSFSEMKGVRPTQEDAIICHPFAPNGAHVFAVLDGHGGQNTSNYSAYELYYRISKLQTIDEDKMAGCIKETLNTLKSMNYNDGSTMALAVITPSKQIISCHLGDARTIVVKDDGSISHFTKDHKPDDKAEIKRILSERGYILKHRVNNVLAVSSSLGDFDVTGVGHEPVIRTWNIAGDEKWLIICCDGVYDVLSNEDVGKIAKKAKNSAELAVDIKNMAFELLSLDNISVIAVDLKGMDTK